MMRTALGYARRGVHVFPVRGKVPIGGHGVLDATTDARVIRAWWTEQPEANVAIAAGLSGLVVLDLDRKNGVDGVATLRRLVGELGRFGPTLRASTPSGGMHAYFRAPEDVEIRPAAGRVGDVEAPGVDVRAGNSYVVAPPSTIEGRAYTWLDRTPPAELPRPWVEALSARSAAPANHQGTAPQAMPHDRARRYALKALEDEGEALEATPAGQRNQALVRAAGVLGQLMPAIGASEIEAVLLAACHHNGSLADDGRRKCMQTIRRGLDWGAANPRVLPTEAA